MTQPRKRHWEDVYESKAAMEVSWYQANPERSLALVQKTGISREAPIIDVGGGASTLVDHLLDAGYTDLTVLDLAAAALKQAQARLAARAHGVDWLVADVMRFEPRRRYRLWHDRAVLHFLTEAADRERYIQVLRRALEPGGHVIIAVFGPDGPMRCSGLDIRRYNVDLLKELLGPEFTLQSQELENHQTPTGAVQQFLYSWWTWRG